MKCWGDITTGITGRKSNGTAYDNNVGDELNEMGNNLKTMDLGTGFTVSDFELERLYVCALSTAGKLKCWGKNHEGQLGQDSTADFLGKNEDELGDNLDPIKLGFTVKQFTLGFSLTCALSTENKIKCWGYNDLGSLGYGDKHNRGEGVSSYTMDDLNYVDLGTNFMANSIDVGGYHACAINSKYEVKCWGYNAEKQVLLGAKSGNAGDEPDEMGDDLKVVKIFHDISGDLSSL